MIKKNVYTLYNSPHRAQKLCFGYKSDYDGRENFRIAFADDGIQFKKSFLFFD